MSRGKKTARIYVGLPGDKLSYSVTVRDAKKPVTINGTVSAVIDAHKGMTLCCAFANAARENAEAFPHPVLLAAFTRGGALIVDKNSKLGQPTTAVRYVHSYGKLVDMNDEGALKDAVKADPSIFEREFILRPRTSRVTRKNNANPKRQPQRKGKQSAYSPKGAMARAVKAGYIPLAVAQQLQAMAASATS